MLLRSLRGHEFRAIPAQEHHHRRVGRTLIAVLEGVVFRRGERESRRLLSQGGIEILAAEGRGGLGDRRVEQTGVPDARRTAESLDLTGVDLEYLAHRQVLHRARRRYSSALAS